jgi:tripartite-type tricarboxylate transporter receptor subunit TctC
MMMSHATLTRRTLIQTVLGAGALALSPSNLFAQTGRTIRLIVPAAPGGAIDAIGRLYAARLKETLNENWIVENKAGASNTLGAAEVARAQPDGLTFLTNADIQIMAKHVLKQVSYDPVADFTPLSRFATSPLVLVGTPSKTPTDLKALMREMVNTPDKHTFANSGMGSMGHLASEGLKSEIGAKTLIVTYRGTAPALQDVLAGQTTLMVAPLGSAAQHIMAGTLRAFAVISPVRSSLLPQVPTMAELGFPAVNYTLWYGLWGPKGLPAATIKSVSEAVQAASRHPDIVEKLRGLGAEAVSETSESFAAFIAEEVIKSAEIVKKAGIVPQG